MPTGSVLAEVWPGALPAELTLSVGEHTGCFAICPVHSHLRPINLAQETQYSVFFWLFTISTLKQER